MDEVKQWRDRVEQEISKVFLGRPELADWLLTAVLADGHILLEDLPGVGKTLLAKALARCLGGQFQRLQCTPDLMPADILGYSLYNPANGRFEQRTGPVMTNVLLVDEINRASPRSQSALLQAMAEGEISRDGQVTALPDPFLVIATENPVEFEGTFPLPEAQKDRFLLSFSLGYPTREQESAILTDLVYGRGGLEAVQPVSDPTTVVAWRQAVDQVFVDPKILAYLLDLVQATRDEPAFSLGVSPRGSKVFYRACRALALLRGRRFVLPDDVKELFLPIVNKRVILKPTVQIRGVHLSEVLDNLLAKVPTPALREVT